MHRAVPVGNKVCAARVRKRYEEQRTQRLKDMKGVVDNTPPQVMGLRHLKVNWKKAEMTSQRYDTIERDNRHLLNHMNNIGARRDYAPTRSHSLPVLRDPPGGPQRQREVERINQENQIMLKRLQGTQAEYRTRDWEDSYRQQQEYMRIKCEYKPPLLQRARVVPRASLTRLPPSRELDRKARADSGAVAEDPRALLTEEELRCAYGEMLEPGEFSEHDGSVHLGSYRSSASRGSREAASQYYVDEYGFVQPLQGALPQAARKESVSQACSYMPSGPVQDPGFMLHAAVEGNFSHDQAASVGYEGGRSSDIMESGPLNESNAADEIPTEQADPVAYRGGRSQASEDVENGGLEEAHTTDVDVAEQALNTQTPASGRSLHSEMREQAGRASLHTTPLPPASEASLRGGSAAEGVQEEDV